MLRHRLLAALVCGSFLSLAEADDKVLYNRDIRPILADACFSCHGPDSASRKADLRIDRSEDAVAARAIVPGKPDDSEVLRRILSSDPDEVMPPPATKKTLTAAQKELIRRWIAQGAEYQPHWSFIAPVRAAVPQAPAGAVVRNPIDNFILEKLTAEGLSAAPEADRRTLARRLALDLTGLPPEPKLVDDFVNDSTPDAYEKLVDRLLAMLEWGEHRARYWLDAARYADTHGIHFDNFREMWSYREWVIRAFNRNLSFDRFTIEQMAGDLLPDRTLDQQIASGFNRCNITTNEGGTIPEEYLVLYARDRTETVSQVWMGLTTGCAVCHDHKFDPISMKDFYSLAAFFNNTTQGAMDGNRKDTPPIVTVPLESDRARWQAIGPEIAAAKQSVEERRRTARPEFDAWQLAAKPDALGPSAPKDGLQLHAPLSEGSGRATRMVVNGESREVALKASAQWQEGAGGGKAVQIQGSAAEIESGVGEFKKSQAYSCAAWVRLAPNDSSGAICSRMDTPTAGYRGWDFWVQGRRIGTHLIHAWPEDALKVVAQPQVKGNDWTHVAVTYDGSGKAAGVKVYYNGQSQPVNVENDKLQTDSVPTVPFQIGQRHAGEPLSGAGLADLRLYSRALSPAEVESLAKASRFEAILAKAPDQRSEAEKNELFQWWLSSQDQAFQTLSNKVVALESEQSAITSRGTIAHIMNERSEEAMAYILFRGEYDQRRDPVKPATPAALPAYPDDVPRNRLGLAQWLLRPEHPLTARVTVNRFWQEVFGQGLVRTTGDFGITGELPTHPELLDWLAVEFRESGWDVKWFFKLLVMSATYRQSAATTPLKNERDPGNRLLARGPRFRMDAEMVRDYALAGSGLLVRKLGGPSVKPYQPEGVWEAVAMIGSNTRDYRRDTGENLYRRSLYTFWKRSAPPASMDIFNAPAREMCTVRRERTNTPLQALVTLNDEQFVEAARALAQRVLLEPAGDETARLDAIGLRLLARPFRPEEKAILQASLKDLSDYYTAHPEDAKKLIAVGESRADSQLDPARLAAWTMLTNEVMNLDEVLCK